MISLFDSAHWIHSPVIGGPRTTAPCPYFRKSFILDKPVREAQLHITSLGLYEAEVNGQRAGDHVFAPGWTNYKVRVPFQTLDVTPLLTDGENVLGVILADGWYTGYVAWLSRQQYGDRPMLLAALEITFDDGTKTQIVSDSTWKTQTGPILASDMLQGESYDARLELGAWSSTGYADSSWSTAIEAATPEIALVQSEAPPVRRIEELSPIQKTPREAWPDWYDQFDFGQNFSGRIRIKIEGPRGTTITIKYAEILEPNGQLYTENLRSATVTDYYTCKGDGVEVFEPRFTFHGFRYVSISGLAKGKIHEVTGIVLHSDTKPTGYFSCSHPMLNQLQHNIV
ncbi:MAG TPA: family 78 glycoside hydrolase catalytic domain, partial [Chthoniobacteraceae bacterium]|nr:family 78 glycoside hydrolase catalytic domain [Chthoniobacteraceae bacterium]